MYLIPKSQDPPPPQVALGGHPYAIGHKWPLTAQPWRQAARARVSAPPFQLHELCASLSAPVSRNNDRVVHFALVEIKYATISRVPGSR